jgi:V/A-type H+-transporting ATPase subunit C
MSAPASHTYLKTRASVMASRLLSEKRLEELTESTLDDVGREFALEELTDSTLSRGRLNRAAERALIRTLMHELSVLLRPLEGSERDILVHWARKFELYNLKALIRGKLQKLSFQQIKQNLHDLPLLISLPHEELLRTENILELLRQLENSSYSDIARQARQVYEDRNEPFSLDATIDHSYFTSLLRKVTLVGATDHEPLRALIGSLIDRHNLIWLMRYRLNYGLSASETYYLLVPFGRQLHQERLKELVNLGSYEQVIEALPAQMAEFLQDTNNPLQAEYILDRESAIFARHSLRFSSSAVTRALAYMVLREMDLKRIYAVMQGKVLNLDTGLIREAAGLTETNGSAHSIAGSPHV